MEQVRLNPLKFCRPVEIIVDPLAGEFFDRQLGLFGALPKAGHFFVIERDRQSVHGAPPRLLYTAVSSASTEGYVCPSASAASKRVRASTGLWPRFNRAAYASSITRPSAAPAGRAALAAAGWVKFATFFLSVVTICSAVAAPMPGRVVRNLTSCRWIAPAMSCTGSTSALSAFLAPTLSTVQNSSKNSTSVSVRKPIRRGTRRAAIWLPST